MAIIDDDFTIVTYDYISSTRYDYLSSTRGWQKHTDSVLRTGPLTYYPTKKAWSSRQINRKFNTSARQILFFSTLNF